MIHRSRPSMLPHRRRWHVIFPMRRCVSFFGHVFAEFLLLAELNLVSMTVNAEIIELRITEISTAGTT